MLPSLTLTGSSSSSSSSATLRVDKATSELLLAPDWTLNIDICDFCNSNHWLAKDVVKEVKKRLQHKNPKVQLLTLTLLETMVKNCGEYIHYHIAERKLLDEMIKILKKKGDMHVRDKILVLLDSWQEAFGGPSGKYPQYYWACDELRRSGVHFPQRSPSSPPVITPPVSRISRVDQVGSGIPPNSSRRLDEAMSSEVESLSNSTLESIQNAVELLDDMLEAVNPNDRMSVKDEVIVELADRCRTYQKKLMQMITTTTDEDLLARGLEMNDSLQSVLARHDGIASGSPLPSRKKNDVLDPSESRVSKVTEGRDETPIEDGKSREFGQPGLKGPNEEDEEEDEFAMLARRHSKAQSTTSQSGTGSTEDAASSSENVNALVVVDAPTTPTPTSNGGKEQDLIDLLSLVLTTSPTSSETLPPPSSAPNSESAPNVNETSSNNYVVPWAQPQQITTQSSQGYSGYSPSYPPPPWEVTSSYGHNQMPAYNNNNPYLYLNNSSVSMQGYNSYSQYGNQPMYSTPLASNNSLSLQSGPGVLQNLNSFHNPPSTNGTLHSASQPINGGSLIQGGPHPLQHVNSFPAKAGNVPTILNNGSSGIPSSGQKPFVPSYRLFDDLNVLGGSEGKLKNGPYPSASGTRI